MIKAENYTSVNFDLKIITDHTAVYNLLIEHEPPERRSGYTQTIFITRSLDGSKSLDSAFFGIEDNVKTVGVCAGCSKTFPHPHGTQLHECVFVLFQCSRLKKLMVLPSHNGAPTPIYSGDMETYYRLITFEHQPSGVGVTSVIYEPGVTDSFINLLASHNAHTVDHAPWGPAQTFDFSWKK